MPWKCPECDYVNLDDDKNLCYCGHLIQDNDKEDITSEDISLPDSNNWVGWPSLLIIWCFPVAFGFLSFYGVILGLLPLVLLGAFGCLYGLCFSIYTVKIKDDPGTGLALAIVGGIVNAVCVIIVLLSCSFTREYGPYSGIVLEKETGIPIIGAVVAMSVSTSTPTAGGPVSSFAYACETVTNENGEFLIPLQKVKKYNPLTGWNKGRIVIFKPGYGIYPSHRDSEMIKSEKKSTTDNEFVSIILPKLNSKEERSKNSHYFGFKAQDRLYVLNQLSDQERIELGYTPYNIHNYWSYKGLLKGGEKTILDFPLTRKTVSSKKIYDKEKRENILNEITSNPNKGRSRSLAGIYTRAQTIINKKGYYTTIKTVKFYIDSEQSEFVTELEKNGIEYLITADNSVEITMTTNDDRSKELEIEKRFDERSRMMFLSDEFKNEFIKLLEENNIFYVQRTVPNTIGFDILWDKVDDDKVNLLKAEFFHLMKQKGA